jgi:hypothetical protein
MLNQWNPVRQQRGWRVRQFHQGAAAMRSHILSRFANPFDRNPLRCVWDLWHVPGWFKYMRTPAADYFGERMWTEFSDRLDRWALQRLGARRSTGAWLSIYTDGCFQGLHRDTENGAWAFVYSLCSARAAFSGGQTLLARPELTSYWQASGFEPARKLFSSHAARFNQLIVFDSRLPHGVVPVSGVTDPAKGRIVVHGWLHGADRVLKGPRLEPDEWELTRTVVLRQARAVIARKRAFGMFCVRLHVDRDGTVSTSRVLSSTLRQGETGEPVPSFVLEAIASRILDLRLPTAGRQLVIRIDL